MSVSAYVCASVPVSVTVCVCLSLVPHSLIYLYTFCFRLFELENLRETHIRRRIGVGVC